MTRTVEEAQAALFEKFRTVFSDEQREDIAAALREARDAALHEAAMAVSSRRGGGTIEHMERLAAVEAIQSLASSPPPAAPARDDRGAEPCACGRTAETGCAKARDRERAASSSGEAARDDRGADEPGLFVCGPCAVEGRPRGLWWIDVVGDGVLQPRCTNCGRRAPRLVRAASSSGEATALRLLALYRAKRAVDGLNGRPWDAVTHLAAEEALAAAGEVADPLASWEARVALRDRIAALAAPSQETETREATAEWTCKHGRNDTTPCPACDGPATEPLAAPAAQRDPEEAPCPECGNEVRHPGTGLLVCECPAPAPSAAPDTGPKGGAA
jgi:hypothetical protein